MRSPWNKILYLTLAAFQRMPPWGQSPESRKLLSKQLKGATEGYSRFGAPKNTCESGLSNIYPTWFACLPATDFLKLLCISVPQFLLLFVVLCSYSLSPLIQKFLTFRCLLFPQEIWYLICILFNIVFWAASRKLPGCLCSRRKSEEETFRQTAARCAEAEFHQVDMTGEVTIF